MPPPPLLRKKDQQAQDRDRDRDFYCSFTDLVLPNPAELPYTLHNPKYKAVRAQPPPHPHPQKHQKQHQQKQKHHITMHAFHPRHRRLPSSSGPRPDSFDSTQTSRTYRSFFSTSTSTSSHSTRTSSRTSRTSSSCTSSSSSSSRRRLLLAKVKQMFRGGREPTHAQVQMLRASSRKPSTLDFRCVGMESRVDMLATAAVVAAGAEEKKVDAGCPPRLEVKLPDEDAYTWGRWFEGLF